MAESGWKWVKSNFQRELFGMVAYAAMWVVFYLLCGIFAYFTSWATVIITVLMGYWLYSRERTPAPEQIAARKDKLVIIAGAGFSGIAMGIRLKQERIKFVIVDKAEVLGGTWFHNVYPGCACDIMSHLYSFSFRMNPFWTRSFPSQPEILTYLKDVVHEYGLRDSMRLGVRITKVEFSEESKKWTVNLSDGDSLVGDYFISAVGALHVPNFPNVSGRDKFQGASFHTAEWDKSFVAKGKNVAVIGTGASAVQVVPALAEDVQSLTVFQRTPAWVPPRLDFHYPRFMQRLFQVLPFLMRMHRWWIFVKQEFGFYFLFQKDGRNPQAESIKKIVTNHMRSIIKDPELKERIVPDFAMGCKRITGSNWYLQAFNRPNVSLVSKPIEQITENGIVADSVEHKFDTIVYATGFDLLKSETNIQVIGRNGTNLAELWGITPNNYLGISTHMFPNMFHLLGPNTGLGHNTIIFMIECQVNYVAKAITHCIDSETNVIEVKKDVHEAYQKEIQGLLSQRVWAQGCKSWYMNKDGVNYTLWPNDLTNYWWRTLNVDFGHYLLSR